MNIEITLQKGRTNSRLTPYINLLIPPYQDFVNSMLT